MKNVISLQKIFENRCFTIPDYQRGYSWEESNWQDLWDDINFLGEDKEHYTGNLVINPTDEIITTIDGSRQKIFEVVDGQQRLTTIVILLRCLYESFRSIRHPYTNGIERTYLRFINSNEQMEPRLKLNADCQDFFYSDIIGDSPSVIGPQIASHYRLLRAKKFFDLEILKLKNSLDPDAFKTTLADLHEKVTQRLTLGEQEVDEATDVGVIFEVMNNRGKPLSELEKVKNYLLYIASKLHVEKNDLAVRINNTWSKIFKTLTRAELTNSDMENRLLRAHWLMAYDPDRRNWDGSKSIKSRFHIRFNTKSHKSLLSDLMLYVESLGKAVTSFCDAIAPARSDAFGSFTQEARTEVAVWSEKLSRTGVRASFLPALMAVRSRHASESESYLAIVKAFELFEFRVFRWQGCRSHAGQTRLIRIGYELYNGSLDLESAVTEIQQKALIYSTNKDFENGFELTSENNFYHWGAIRYFLYEYELHCAAQKGARVRWDEIANMEPKKTIEHILPQTPDEPYWQENFSSEEIKYYTHALGNLCLTMDNSSYWKHAFPRKCGGARAQHPCYAQSKLFSEQKIARDFDDWTPETITKRQTELKEWALQRWRIEPADFSGEPDIDEEIEEAENLE